MSKKTGGAPVILATHSEVILNEALDHNLTLLLAGRADDLAGKTDIKNTLKHYGAEHYIRARQRGYVLYVEGSTDVEILRALARKTGHAAAQVWDERINSFYVQDGFSDGGVDAELARVEGGFGLTPQQHFFALRSMLPELRGLALLDSDGRDRADSDDGGLRISYWRRYECENYIVTPDTLSRFARDRYGNAPPLFESDLDTIDEVLDALILEHVFEGREREFGLWKAADPETGRLVWTAQTQRLKLSALSARGSVHECAAGRRVLTLSGWTASGACSSSRSCRTRSGRGKGSRG